MNRASLLRLPAHTWGGGGGVKQIYQSWGVFLVFLSVLSFFGLLLMLSSRYRLSLMLCYINYSTLPQSFFYNAIHHILPNNKYELCSFVAKMDMQEKIIFITHCDSSVKTMRQRTAKRKEKEKKKTKKNTD